MLKLFIRDTTIMQLYKQKIYKNPQSLDSILVNTIKINVSHIARRYIERFCKRKYHSLETTQDCTQFIEYIIDYISSQESVELYVFKSDKIHVDQEVGLRLYYKGKNIWVLGIYKPKDSELILNTVVTNPKKLIATKSKLYLNENYNLELSNNLNREKLGSKQKIILKSIYLSLLDQSFGPSSYI